MKTTYDVLCDLYGLPNLHLVYAYDSFHKWETKRIQFSKFRHVCDIKLYWWTRVDAESLVKILEEELGVHPYLITTFDDQERVYQWINFKERSETL